MNFKDLISPKWKNSNPDIRLQAVKAIDNNNLELLKQLFSTENNTSIRHAIIKKISDEEILSETAVNDKDESIRDTALSKLHKLYAERIISMNCNADRLAILDLIDDEEIMLSISASIDNPEFRVSIVNKISSPKRLCTLTELNCGFKAGKVIIEKTDDVKYLERISKNASGKKIRKMAIDKIALLQPKTITKSEDNNLSANKVSEIETLCSTLKTVNNSTDIKTIDNIIKNANFLLKDIHSTQTHPSIIQLTSAVADLQELHENLKQKSATTFEYQTLINDIKQLSDQIHFLNDDKNTSENIIRKWNAVNNNIDKTEYENLYSEFEKGLSLFQEKFSFFMIRQEEEYKQIETLQNLCQKAETIRETNDSSTIDKDLKAIEEKWRAVYTDTDNTKKLLKQFDTIVASCQETIAKNIEAENIKTKAVITKLLDIIQKASDKNGNALFKKASEVKSSISQWQKLNNIDSNTNNTHYWRLTFLGALRHEIGCRPWYIRAVESFSF